MSAAVNTITASEYTKIQSTVARVDSDPTPSGWGEIDGDPVATMAMTKSTPMSMLMHCKSEPERTDAAIRKGAISKVHDLSMKLASKIDSMREYPLYRFTANLAIIIGTNMASTKNKNFARNMFEAEMGLASQS